MRPLILTLACLSFAFPAVSPGEEFRTDADDRHDLSLTVYNAGRALVRDHRRFSPPQPVGQVAFSDVAQQIITWDM